MLFNSIVIKYKMNYFAKTDFKFCDGGMKRILGLFLLFVFINSCHRKVTIQLFI